MAEADILVPVCASAIPRIGPGREVAENRPHRVRRQILRPEDAERIVTLAVDHYVSAAPGEISRVVARRTRYSQEIVDAVLVAALLTVRGNQDVRRHCDRLAVEMAAERARDSRAEFQDWLKGRCA